MRKAVFMHQTITDHDAVGNDIEAMYNILSTKFCCKCFAENRLNSRLVYMEETELLDVLQDETAIVIYHHSNYWLAGEDLLKAGRAKIIFRYHNITPPEFFKNYCRDYFEACTKGREQTERLIDTFPKALWMADSEYNMLDLTGVPIQNLAVIPPFHKIEEWTKSRPDENVLKELVYDPRIKVVFVSRIAPNKGHLQLINVMAAYCTYFNSDICLYIVGKSDDGTKSYYEEIISEIQKYNLQDNVKIVGEITNEILMSYYICADVYLCMSEHEGFCVPVIEAQKLGLPVIAKRSTAVTETIGSNQLLLGDNIYDYAAAIHIVANDNEIRNYLAENGRKNYSDRFTYGMIEEKFLSFLKNGGINI